MTIDHHLSTYLLKFIKVVMMLMACVGLASCGGSGAVVFEYLPNQAEGIPTLYTHPSGAFAVLLPSTWAVYEHYWETLAEASFSSPTSGTPLLHVGVIRLTTPIDSPDDLLYVLNEYQQKIRPDHARYKEIQREAMGDGSWRLSGLRSEAGGTTQQLNTFVQFAAETLAVIEVIVGENDTELQGILNTFQLYQDHILQPTDLSAFALASQQPIEFYNVSAWTTSTGVFFITGEVRNRTDFILSEIPIRAVLYTPDGRGVAEGIDKVMGHGIPPGEFFPFSLRFGQGQPVLSETYRLFIGDQNWIPNRTIEVYGEDHLDWTVVDSLTPDGFFQLSGTVTNQSEVLVYLPMVTASVFDDQQRLIGAGFTKLEDVELEPGQSLPYTLVMAELGATPARYLVKAQGIP